MDNITISNMALSHIGVANIDRIDEASEPARLCKQFFDMARRSTLRRFPWPFATRRETLGLLDTEPGDYAYAYRYPKECVAIRKLYDENYQEIPEYQRYKILGDKEGRVIYTNVEKCICEYTADVKDCDLFDDGFVEALSWKLAADIAFKLTGNQNIQNQCLQAYNAYFDEGSTDAANEENELDPRLDRFARARF
ncbi:MAG: hypothetical protein IJ056_09500 [Acidaminococcaceae bacterium]|nr:hypothetical protein [Acidaminococcaceae bacterium]